MTDLAGLFAVARRFGDAARYYDGFGRAGGLLRDVVGLLPVRAAGEGYFEVMEFAAARPADFRPVVAVRQGVPAHWIDAPAPLPEGWADLAMEMGVEAPPADTARIAYPAGIACPVHGVPLPGHAARLRWWGMVAGLDVVDLIACDYAMRRPPRVFLGHADALGDATGDAADEADEAAPLPVVECVADALFGPPGCVLPLGDAGRRAAYLRRASALVAPSLDLGRKLKRLVEAPVAAPKLFVMEAA